MYLRQVIVTAVLLCCPALCAAETCTTQSQMKPADRDGLALAANSLALAIQSDDESALRNGSIAELQADFASVSSLAVSTAPHLKGVAPEVEQIYLLDGSTLAKTDSGANPDAQFFCTLNQSSSEADFNIPQLPPGRYGFAMVRFAAEQPVRVSMLLRQEGGAWHLAGFYPKALTADGGHDGLWFWQQARTLRHENAPWTSWLYLQEAQTLLTPASFVSSTHLEKLATELTTNAPPALSGGLSASSPLVIKGLGGAEFRVTSLTPDDSLGPDKLDVAVHIKVDAVGDAAAARQRNLAAAAALLTAHPELRKSFHGVWIFADAPNNSPYATELAMSEIR